MRRITALTAITLAVCTGAAHAGQPRLEINPVVAQPTCERTDLVLGEGPSAFHVVRRWAGDGWLTSLDAGLHLEGEQAWVLTLDAQAHELVKQDDAWITRAGAPLLVTQANGGYRMLNQTTGDVLWFDELGTPVALESSSGRLEFEPAGFGVGGVRGAWGRLGVERDRAGRPTALHAPGANVTYRYEGELLSSVTGPRGDEVYSYAEGRLAQAGATRVSYDDEGRACALEGGRAPLRISYRDDPEWTLVAEVSRSAQREVVHYSEARRLLVVEGESGRSETRFDGRLRPMSVTHNGALVMRRSYDSLQRLTVLETAEGLAHWHYTGDATQPARVTLPSGADVRYVRNEAGQVTLRQGPRGVERFAYDVGGALIKHRSPLGVVTKLERDAHGYCVALERAGRVTRFERGADGEVARITTPDGRETQFESKGRRVLVRDERGLVYAAAYDEAGRAIAWRDASGRTLRYEYNAMGLMTRAYDGEGELLRCAYSELGELVAVTDATGNTVRYERPKPRTVVVHDPSSGERTLRYDTQGNLIEELRGDAKLSYRYDSAGRLVERTTPDGRERISYDARGRMISRSSASATLRYGYTPDGQLAELRNSALNATIRFGYDEHGLRNEVALPWGKQRYERDSQGRVTAVVADGERVEFDLLPDGRRAAVRYPNGVTTAFSYDREQLTTIETTHEGELLDRRTYTYDAAGHVTSCSDANGETVRYTYDARGQLLSAAGEARFDYAYDAQGNRVADAADGVQRDLELGVGNRVQGAGEQRFHYDARGALVRSEGPEGETRYRYDVDGRLREVRGPGEARVRYGYAPDGSRLWREGAAGRVFELNDGTHVLGERAQGEWVTRYVHGDDVDDLLLAQRDEGSYAYHTDLVRSVTAVSGPEGEVAARYSYGPFGEAQLAEGPAAAWNPWRYTSRGYDVESGLYDYRARSYDPQLGRFTSTDPSGRLGGVNLYAYASNDPVRFNDPYGLEAMPGRGDPTVSTTPNAFERTLTSMDEAAAGLNPIDRGAYELVRGAGDFVGDTVMGVVDLFKKQTWIDLGEAIDTIKEDPAILKEIGRQMGTGVVDKFDEYVDAWQNDPWKALRMTGYGIASAATVAVGAIKAIQTISAVAKAVKASKAAKRAAQAAKAARAAKGGAKATGVAVAANAGRGGQAASAAGKAGNTIRRTEKGIKQAIEELQGGASTASKGLNGGPAQIAPKKFDYLFGRVTTGAHNAPRSAQNLAQMRRLGVPDNARGRAMIRDHLDDVARRTDNVKDTFTNEHGTFVVKESLFPGPSGKFANFETTWQVMPDGSMRFSTLIPRGGPK